MLCASLEGPRLEVSRVQILLLEAPGSLVMICFMVGQQQLYQLLALGQAHVALKLGREGYRFVGVWGYDCDSKHMGSWIPFHCIGCTGPKWRLLLLFGGYRLRPSASVKTKCLPLCLGSWVQLMAPGLDSSGFRH